MRYNYVGLYQEKCKYTTQIDNIFQEKIGTRVDVVREGIDCTKSYSTETDKHAVLQEQ